VSNSEPTISLPGTTTGIPGVELLGDAPMQKITAGDVVVVSIYTSGGGLFGGGEAPGGGVESTSQNTVTTLPPQLVDSSGALTVPHVGQIPAVGKTPYEVENEITAGLKGQAIQPYVIVSLQDRKGSDLVTVTGDVKTPSRVSVPQSGLRVVDAVTAAGGSTARDNETTVYVWRAGKISADNYRDILADPNKNIFLGVGDTILVKTSPWTYTSLGATGQTVHAFPTEQLTAEEALAGVSGLNDDKANPEAVFVYRFESPSTLKALGTAPQPVTADGVPVIYQLDLRQPDGFFLARQFNIRDKDIIFVGNAGSIGIIKAMNIVGSLTAPAIGGLSATAGAATIAH
jgi:polysaccharide export outer membrane protein